jgi:hypothetical protein
MNADFERIEEVENRSGPVGYMVSALEALAKGLPSIRTTKDPGDYEMIVVGTPVWAGNMASPIRTYLTLNRARLRHIAFFAVMGGQGADHVLREMKFLAGADDAPSCTLMQSEVQSMNFSSKLADFANMLTYLVGRESAPVSSGAEPSTWFGEGRDPLAPVMET